MREKKYSFDFYEDNFPHSKVVFHRSYFGDKTCDYGFGGNRCKDKAVVLIPWGFNGFPGELFTCEKHLAEMTSPFIAWAYSKMRVEWEKDVKGRKGEGR